MPENTTRKIKSSLIELGGRTSQDMGMGRVVGQVLVYLYLTDGDCSLDKIEKEIQLSKASASIAARQLEKLGLVKRSWKKGDRKSYYRTADNIETALKNGLISFMLQKIQTVGRELDHAIGLLSNDSGSGQTSPETEFVRKRLTRAKALSDGFVGVLENPFFKLFE
ncbi:MAG: MarR family transcriptional regulator [Deltaproteobacteria bacterium]|nr:MarR family transcriptional regulator [Deltaproteobacteria bacterium]MBW2152340.1 MarR family transcriptional regulator [Deltaproteobacteria bacterium]